MHRSSDGDDLRYAVQFAFALVCVFLSPLMLLMYVLFQKPDDR